ncbi:hypothetical protein Taro_015520 [Colocasia esculenta]|uniref:Uncharacterized protein n=1 Tax=Colocasia esculenta TaxID=4460 RepID=A0A843UI18_COLES|nr:hypothetical protein [Colocasia esculenta]
MYVASSTTPTVVTSPVGCPRFFVSQAVSSGLCPAPVVLVCSVLGEFPTEPVTSEAHPYPHRFVSTYLHELFLLPEAAIHVLIPDILWWDYGINWAAHFELWDGSMKVPPKKKVVFSVFTPAFYEQFYEKETRLTDWFEQYRERLMEAEQMILTTLNFELNVHHPYTPLASVLDKLGLSQTVLVSLAWNLINEGVLTRILCSPV